MAPSSRDYFAEMYVAGTLADAGWNIYFPHRDQGFDFIVTKAVGDDILVRPVQVKGKYPTEGKTDKNRYGYSGRLSQLHPEMVLAIPFFPSEHSASPVFIAFMPAAQIRRNANDADWHSCFPALFAEGNPHMRRDYQEFFDASGVKLMEQTEWSSMRVDDTQSF